MAFDQGKYANKFNKENYDRVVFQVRKGNKKILKELAKIKDVSVNALITEAVENYYHIDISSKQDDEV